MALGIWTIGHSTRSSDQLTQTLHAHRIALVADVRRFPASRRLPHFASSALEEHLARNEILYRWIPSLGGRRRSTRSSGSSAWRAPGFQAYADHVASGEFADGLFELLMLASGARIAIMCAEMLWWRCHRRLIADVLHTLGVEVWHVRDEGDATRHRLALPARLVGGVLTYDVR